MRQAGTSCTFDGFRYDGDRGESLAGFVLLKARATNDGGYLLGEETSDGGAWGENDHTSAVNEDLDVSTHSERSPGHSLRRGRDRRYECTSIVASETLRVNCQEKSQAGALCQNVGKITIIHLKDPRR